MSRSDHRLPSAFSRPGAPCTIASSGCFKAAFDEIIEHRPPRRLTLAAHVAHRQQNLLPVGTNTQHHQRRNRRRFVVMRTRTTVPSRISRTIASLDRSRAFHASQSPLIATPGTRCPSIPSHGTVQPARVRPGACSSRPDSCRQSPHRSPSCGADRPAASGCATRCSCHRLLSLPGREAPVRGTELSFSQSAVRWDADRPIGRAAAAPHT
jgi:hypothetical protein